MLILYKKGVVSNVITSSVKIFELIGQDGVGFCGKNTIGLSDPAKG